jgi:hypothetical protein
VRSVEDLVVSSNKGILVSAIHTVSLLFFSLENAGRKKKAPAKKQSKEAMVDNLFNEDDDEDFDPEAEGEEDIDLELSSDEEEEKKPAATPEPKKAARKKAYEEKKNDLSEQFSKMSVSKAAYSMDITCAYIMYDDMEYVLAYEHLRTFIAHITLVVR